MASNQSFAIDKYSFCDVPMSQHDSKPTWNHHSARDHLYLVLNLEGPLEQPSVPGFPYMKKLILKIIWRAETLETIHISDVIHQRSNYVDFPNLVCMIRNPSLALKYVNLRSHTLQRLQVRFCRQDDFQAVISSLERIGCPVQLHNVDVHHPVPQNPSIINVSSRPDTANTLLTAGSGVQRQYGVSRPSNIHGNSQGSGISNHQMPPNMQRISLGPQASVHIPNREYISPQSYLQQGFQSKIGHQDTVREPFRFQRTVPEPSEINNASMITHERKSSYTGRTTDHSPLQYICSSTPKSASSHDVFSNNYGQELSNTNSVNPFETAYHANLHREGSATSSFVSRPETGTSVPVSRGTLTSAGTLFGPGNSQVQGYHIPPSSAANNQPQNTQNSVNQNISDDDIPPPRQLPDFDKLGKVHGDKPLPSSSGKITSLLKTSKTGSSTNPPSKRKPKSADTPSTSIAPKPVAKKAKTVAKKPVSVPKSDLSSQAAKPKPKKPKTTATTKTVITPVKDKPGMKSPNKTIASSPPQILQKASSSVLNAKANQQSPPKSKTVDLSQLVLVTNNDIDSLDENLLAQMIHSDEHLKMVQKLEKIWGRLGFQLRLRASGIFNDSRDNEVSDTTIRGEEKENS